MDIIIVRPSDAYSGLSDEENEDMALKGTQVQGDYSDYVPPEVVVTDNAPVPSRKISRSKPPPRGGPVRPESPTEVPVEVRGNLHKLGKRLKGWHQRYFEIQGSHMYYYKTYTKKECLGEINLSKCYFCDATSIATFGHPFEIQTTERSHTLAARTHDEMSQWVRVIRKNLGTTEEEGAARRAAKPKRWDTFKQALSIQPRAKPKPADIDKKKTNRKSFGNKFKLGRGKESPTLSRGDTHAPLAQEGTPSHIKAHSERPLSFTEDEVGRDTLEILASLQPSRSLPATPLVTKRPVDFNESPSHSPTFQRDTPASPALTLDSTLSTPIPSLPTSPAHAVSAPEPEVKEVQVEVTSSEPVTHETISQEAPAVTVTESSVVEAEVTVAESSEVEAEAPVVTVTESSVVETEAPVVTITESSVTEAEVLDATLPEDEPTPRASAEELSVDPIATGSPESVTQISKQEKEVHQLDLSDLPPLTDPEVLKKRYTWDDIRVLLDSAEDGGNDYSSLPPEEGAWLSKEKGVEQLRAFLLSCP